MKGVIHKRQKLSIFDLLPLFCGRFLAIFSSFWQTKIFRISYKFILITKQFDCSKERSYSSQSVKFVTNNIFSWLLVINLVCSFSPSYDDVM